MDAPQSLHRRDKSAPHDVIQRSLVAFRRPGLIELRDFLPPGAALDRTVVHVAGNCYEEQGPLASLSNILCVAARRTLPGHLLRRSRVLGSLRGEDDTFRQRIEITACTGEVVQLDWLLRSSCNDEGEGWKIWRISHDLDPYVVDSGELPTTPHPKHSPEEVIAAQIVAMRQNDMFEASIFNAWVSQTEELSKDYEYGFQGVHAGKQYRLLRRALVEDSFLERILTSSREHVFGASALPTQETMVQEMFLRVPGVDRSSQCFWARVIWTLALRPNGCWMITNIGYPSDGPKTL